MSPDLSNAIRAVLGVAHAMNLDAVLIGALVAELAAVEDADLTPPRGTNDADFAFKIKDWEEFARLKKGLVEAGLKPDPKIEHRLYYKSAMVDILPYGPQISKQGEIVWPISERSMVVLGFDEACAQAVESQVESDLRVRRLSIPGFVLLKIMAFLDRRAAGNQKYRSDAEDLLYWFNQYASGKHEQRRYMILEKGITEVNFDSAGAAVLGLDIRTLASPGAAIRIGIFLQDSADPYGPLANAVVSPGFDEHRERVVSLVSAFRRGFEAS